MNKKIKMLAPVLCAIIVCCFCVMQGHRDPVDILNVDAAKVQHIHIYDHYGFLSLRVWDEEEINKLMELFDQIEVVKSGPSEHRKGYEVEIFLHKGPHNGTSYLEGSWNYFCILNAHEIWYDGVLYEVVAGDLGAILTRLASIHAGQQGAS